MWESKNFNCKLNPPYNHNVGYMLSEFNFSRFVKPILPSTNVPARFNAFSFSCNSCRNQTNFYGSWRKQRQGKWSDTLTCGIDTI